MTEKGDETGDETGDDRGWHWAYVIPLAALMIPIIAVIGNDAIVELFSSWVTAIIVLLAGGTLAGRSLLRYRHELRLEEFAAQRDIAAAEALQLSEAQKLLDLDDRIETLQYDPKPEDPLTT